jgi:Ca-activated chloride channel family protein
MNWGAPHILWLLLALPVWAWINLRVLRARRRRLAAWVDEKAHPFLLPGRNPAAAPRHILLRTAALACLVLALARPQWGFHWEEITRRGLDLLVVLDTSRSMTAADIKPSRLQQAKWGIHDLLRNLRGDRVGLVPFAGSSLLQCPLTTDYAAFAMTLDDLYCGIIPRGGTAIAQALRTAIDAFPDDTAADRCILLVTDGEDHEGDPLSLLPELKEKNIRLYAIGIGTLEGEMIPADPSSGGAYFKDRKGQIVKTTLHEDVLQQLAVSTGGTYVRSAAGDTGLERVFRESIDKLKRSEQENRTAKINEERFQWPLLLSLLLLLLESLTPDRTTPQGARGPSPRPLQSPSHVPFVLFVSFVSFALLASPSRAQSPRPLFTAGLADLAASNYPSATSNFLAAAELAPTNNLSPAPALYNAALATAAAGDPDTASTLLAESARAIPDLAAQARAYYNLGNTLYRQADADPTSTNSATLIADALQSYENAIALDPAAPDYKANYELAVLKQQQIQEQQQQQQQNQQQSSDENQDQSDDQQQSQPQDQQQQESDQQDQQEQSPPQESQQSQDSQSSPQSQESPQSPSQESPEPQPSEQMTPEEAALLLDAMRAREQSQRDQLKPLFGRPIPVENDW